MYMGCVGVVKLSVCTGGTYIVLVYHDTGRQLMRTVHDPVNARFQKEGSDIPSNSTRHKAATMHLTHLGSFGNREKYDCT